MSLEATGWGEWLLVFIMAAITLATRLGGVVVMTKVPITAPVERFIAGMSGSVLVALLAPLALDGDMGARSALATTAAVMLVTRKPLPAISAGLFAAALVRHGWTW